MKNFNIQDEWVKFCDKLYANVLEMEKRYMLQSITSRNLGESFEKRKFASVMLEKCIEYKWKLKNTIPKQKIVIDDKVAEIILSRGAEYYFKTYTNV